MRVLLKILLVFCPILSIGQDTFNKIMFFEGYGEEITSLIVIDTNYYFIGGGIKDSGLNNLLEMEIFITNEVGELFDSIQFDFDTLRYGMEHNSENLYYDSSNSLYISASLGSANLSILDGSLFKFDVINHSIEYNIFKLDSIDLFVSLFESNYNLFVFGQTDSKGNGRADYYALKTDTLGNLIADTTYGGVDFEQIGNAIKVDEDKIILCGLSSTYANVRPFFAVQAANAQFICVDTNFNVLWDKVLYTDGTDFAPMIKEHGFFYYTIEHPVTNQYRDFLKRIIGQIDINTGDVLWMDTIDIADDIIHRGYMETVDDTSFIIFARVDDPNYNGGLAKIIKYNNHGEIVWQRKYYDGNHDGCYLNAMEVDNDGYLVFGGSIANLETNSQDAWILKLDPNGCLDSTDCGIPEDTVGIIDLTPGLNKFNLKVFPNPATDHVNIVVENTANYTNEILELSVYDLSGKLVYRSMQTLTKNIPLFQLDVGNYPSGTYMIQTCVNGKSCGNEILVVDN